MSKQYKDKIVYAHEGLTCTGVDGGADLIDFPVSSNMFLTLPQAVPATRTAPRERVPRWITQVASWNIVCRFKYSNAVAG